MKYKISGTLCLPTSYNGLNGPGGKKELERERAEVTLWASRGPIFTASLPLIGAQVTSPTSLLSPHSQKRSETSHDYIVPGEYSFQDRASRERERESKRYRESATETERWRRTGVGHGSGEDRKEEPHPHGRS